jgi:hypothetical protein
MSILPGPEIRAKLAPWIGAAEPHGTIARVWTNEAARGSINHFALRPDHIKRGQLSLLAAEGIDPKRAAQGAAAPPPVNGNVKLDPKWPKRAVKPENFGTIPAGSALVIFDLRGVNFHQGNGFLVSRVGPDLNTPPSTIDHATDSLYVIQGALSGGKTLAFAVPPGRWRIAAQINGAITLNYCLGAPEFEVKESEVVFAGVLDMKAEDLTPDLSLDRVKLWMAGTAAAEKVRPAVYINGSRGACGPNTIFALEFKGAPYMPGYALGGAIGSAP